MHVRNTKSRVFIGLFLGLIILGLISIFRVTEIRAKETTDCKIIRSAALDSRQTNLPKQDTTVFINNRKVLIKTPGKHKKLGVILVLPGWNFPSEDWCLKTTLCEKATENGYYLVLPEMGKSVYQESDFLETRADWKSYPTRKWVTDTMIPELRKSFSLLIENDNNFLIGLSTGARGVALITLDLPKLFKGVAALSGDYNQSIMQNDNLMKGYYGPYEKFKSRWDSIDNPFHRIKELITPIYLGHGTADKIVPPEQTKLFYQALVKVHPHLKVKLHMPEAGHDYNYWGSEVNNVFDFFSELK